MSDHCLQFIRCVADTMIVCQRDPAARADFLQPFFVWRIVYEMVGVPLNPQSGVPQYFRELLPEIAIRKIDKAQAARS